MDSIEASRAEAAYRNREVTFSFRKRSYNFSLSLELFSSADVDAGSRFLLKVFSAFLDKAAAGLADGSSPYSVLDAGSGVGVLGICAAGALSALLPARGFYVRTQDRDCLARLFTEYNARRNGIGEEMLSAHAEPLLAGPPEQRWDIVLTNIPAKAGRPVLEDFVRRSAGLLKKDGRVFLVAVNTLAGFFRLRIAAAGAPLLWEEPGKEHTVFVYGAGNLTPNSERACEAEATRGAPIIFDEGFPSAYPFYVRNRNDYTMEDISYRLDTVYGAPDFDEPGGAVKAAAKLAVKIDLASKLAEGFNEGEAALLVNDAGQGHFALWLACYLRENAARCRWVLSGRNVLALAAARAALGAAVKNRPCPSIVPSVDVFPKGESSAGDGFAFTAFFPEAVPDTEAAWESLSRIAALGGIVILGMASAGAERFDRKKPPAFTRAGDIKRKGFRALAYMAPR